ncbi:RNA polymerase sigma factor [Cytobacillus dafuensis]|uniref:RNA polymerase sigma factor n=1 Tax=Cytobacillus dafuensis TaxID=1742359 RepID=A0A5B8Z5F1_CYTDA|nr:RNA polymerase sigma factor [Cytobacillus dafuensis]
MGVENSSVDMKEICDLYHKRLFHVAYGITRDYYLAQDVVQETLIKAYLKINTIQEKEKIGAWLSAIATRTAIDFIRKERKTNENIEAYADLDNAQIKMNHNVEEEVEINLLNEKINDCINSLSIDQKRVFMLKIRHGLKEREIAELLELNQNTVKTKLYRVRKYLKQMLVEKDLA